MSASLMERRDAFVSNVSDPRLGLALITTSTTRPSDAPTLGML